MPIQKDYGYRTSVMLRDDTEKQIQKYRKAYFKTNGFRISRSAVINMALHDFLNKPENQFNPPAGHERNKMKGATNGQ